jgi:hypothetical protein
MNGVRGSFCENHGKALPRSRNTSKKDKFMSKNLKHLNALKHGAFSQMVLFPGEDREEFNALHQALIEEWNPEWPTQHDKVFNVAQNMWRKRRLATYRKERAEFGERVLLGGEKQIEQALKYLESPEAEKLSSDLRLPVPKRDHFERTLPREKFRSDAAYREVIAEAVVRWFCGHKIILDELAVEERLDAKIDKDLAALGRMKTMQQMGLGRRHVVIDQTATPMDAPEAPVELPAGQVGGPSDQVEVPTSQVESPPLAPELAGVDGGQPDAPAEAPAEQVDVGQPEAQAEVAAAPSPTQPASAEDVDKKDAA